MMYPKPGRVKDSEVYLDCFKDWCEVCGAPIEHPRNSKGQFLNGPHHVISRNSGGADIRENLIQLCRQHHAEAHNGTLSKDELWQIIASREAMSIEDVRTACIDGRRRAHVGEWNG